MLRFMRSQRLLSSFKCVSVKKGKTLAEVFTSCREDFPCPRLFCLQASLSSDQSPPPNSTLGEQPLAQRLGQILDPSKVVSLLNETAWDEDTPNALRQLKVNLSVFVVYEAINICTDLDTALEFYKWWRTMSGNEPDSYVYVALMVRLGRAGRLEEMEAIASECETGGMVNVATFVAQLSAYKKARNLDAALGTWRRMEKFGVKPDLASYTTMIDVLATLKLYEEAGNLYLLFLSEKNSPNVKTVTVLIYHLAEARRMDAALAIFEDLPKIKLRPNALTYAALMGGYAKVGNIDATFKLAQELKDVGLRPHRDSFKNLFGYLFRKGKVEDAMGLMYQLWPEHSMEWFQSLVAYYQGELEKDDHEGVDLETDASDAEEIDNAVVKRTSLWNYAGLIKCLTPWTPATAAALAQFDVKWDGHLVLEIMKRIKNEDVGWNFFNWVEGRNGFHHDRFTYIWMINLLLAKGNFRTVKQLLVEAQNNCLSLPMHTYNKVIESCGRKNEADVALETFSLLDNAGLKPDVESYEYLLHALHICGRYWRAATVLREMQNAGFSPSSTLYSLVVCGLAKAGHINYAKAYYSRMRARGHEPDDAIYQAFIEGFYKAGRLDKAEQVFKQMKKDGRAPSVQVYDLMVKVLKQAWKRVELNDVHKEREALIFSRRSDMPHPNVEKYYKFYGVFVESFREEENELLYSAG